MQTRKEKPTNQLNLKSLNLIFLAFSCCLVIYRLTAVTPSITCCTFCALGSREKQLSARYQQQHNYLSARLHWTSNCEFRMWTLGSVCVRVLRGTAAQLNSTSTKKVHCWQKTMLQNNTWEWAQHQGAKKRFCLTNTLTISLLMSNQTKHFC